MTRTVRRAGAADARSIASVHIASSNDAYAPLAACWPAEDIDARAAKWAKRLTEEASLLVIVAEDEGAVVGFAAGGPARRQEPHTEVEIYAIHVTPTLRGQGVGHAIWNAACSALRGPALAAIYVDTLAELRACSFYERHGGQVTERASTSFLGALRTHVTYRWKQGARSDLQSRA